MFVKVQINKLPIILTCCTTDAHIAFEAHHSLTYMEDQSETGVKAIFDQEGFKFNGVEYNYHELYDYKRIPDMLAWLQQQQMLMPNFD
jgi:hypothetical protein